MTWEPQNPQCIIMSHPIKDPDMIEANIVPYDPTHIPDGEICIRYNFKYFPLTHEKCFKMLLQTAFSSKDNNRVKLL